MASINACCQICLIEDNELLTVSGPNHRKDLDHKVHQACLNQWLDRNPERFPSCVLCTQKITLLNGKPIRPATSENHPLVVAARSNCLEDLQGALTGENIPPQIYQVAIMEAAVNGHGAIVQSLLENREELRGDAVVAATWGKYRLLVRDLLNGGVITNVDRGRAFRATNEEDRSIFLTDEFDDEEEYRREYRIIGNHEIWRIQHEAVPISEREKSFENIVYSGEGDPLKAVLGKWDLSDQIISAAVPFASLNGFAQVVRVLLDQGKTSMSDRETALFIAIGKFETEIARMLIADGPISYSDFLVSLSRAKKSEQKDIVNLLCKAHPLFAVFDWLSSFKGGFSVFACLFIIASFFISKEYLSLSICTYLLALLISRSL